MSRWNKPMTRYRLVPAEKHERAPDVHPKVRRNVYDAVKHAEGTLQEIIDRTGYESQTVLRALQSLEYRGLVVRVVGMPARWRQA